MADPNRCPPNYKNVKLESFGNERKVTEAILKQFCMNSEYNYQEIKKLWDATDPELRKRFTPALQNDDESWGTSYDQGKLSYIFSNETGFRRNELFKNLLNIDITKSTAYINTAAGEVSLKPQQVTTIDKSTTCLNPAGHGSCNAYWYITYNRSKKYQKKPEWIKNPKNTSIPSVCRAQTFVAKKSGILESIGLRLKGQNNAEDWLYVELRSVTNKNYPSNTILAETKFKFQKNSSGGIVSIPFPQPPRVTANTRYAIVLRSPLTTYAKRFGIGGWGKNCYADACPNGDAFLSENNGKTWLIYGKAEKVTYKEGKYAPVDFGYEAYIRETNTVYTTNTDFYVYLTPVQINPVKSVTLSVTDDVPTNTSITYQVSRDGKTWYTVNQSNQWTKDFTEPYTQFIFVRAILRTNTSANTPKVKGISMHCDTEPAVEAYCKTHYFNPDLTPMLQASIWSKMNMPYETEPNTSVKADIFRDIELVERYKIIEYLGIKDYLDDTEANSITTVDKAREYIDQHPEFVEELANDSIYIIGRKEFPLSEPAVYPTLECYLQPEDTAVQGKDYAEWHDYTIDYENDKLIFNSDVNLVAGDLRINYNPIWIKNVTLDEMPLKMDLFKEEFDSNNVSDTIKLRVSPVDPIRKVLVNEDTDNELELFEDIDFTVDYLENTIKLHKPLSDDENISIRYTPYLKDTGLGVAYRMSRSNNTNQAYIQGNYFEYRV